MGIIQIETKNIDQINSGITLSYNLTLEPGLYNISIFVWANSSLGESRLCANGKSVVIKSGGAIQIDGAKTWDEVRLEKVNVESDGVLELKVLVGTIDSTVTGYLDYIMYERTGTLPLPGDNLIHEELNHNRIIIDCGFAHKGPSVQDSNKKITGLENGYYTVTAWTQNNGGHDVCRIYAADTGAPEIMTAVPRNNFPYEEANFWKKTTLRGIHVNSGNITVGLHTEGGNSSACLPVCSIDKFMLVKDDKPYMFLNGGDITELNYVEDKGGVFYDFNGNRRDALEILAESGWNIARIRIYNDPGKGRGDGTYYVPEGYQDLNDALRLAKRAESAGMQIQFTLHFSDYWTNPGTQIIPHDWQALIDGKTETDAVQILNEEIYKFTKDTLIRMKAQNTTPEFVSLGNETRTGMLFPYGTTDKWDVLAGFYNSGAGAVRETAPDSKIIIHLDDGGNLHTYMTYFQNARQRNVDYDIIGASYYPFWTQKTAAQFASFADSVTLEFNKPVMCMETGLSWAARTGAGNVGQLSNNGPYGSVDSSTPELQKDFLIDFFNEMQGVGNGMCIGSLYWDPVMIYAGGKTGWAYYESNDMNTVNVVDNTALFDFNGRALPALSAYKYNTR